MKAVLVFAALFVAFVMTSCGGGSGSSSGNGGITPGALSWTKISTPAGATQINFLSFSSGNHWFIADRNKGFFRSTDQGATWTQINSGLSTTLGWTINVNPANGDLIASTYSGTVIGANPVVFYLSTNEGDLWTAIPYRGLDAATAQTGCAFAANTNVVCGGYWAPSPASGAWVSSNGAKSVISISSNYVTGTSVYSLALNPSTNDLWLGTEKNGIFRSSDNGMTWSSASPSDSSINDGNIYAINFDRNGNVLFGSLGGIWKSSKSGSGYSWTNVFPNHNTATGKGLGRDANGVLYYGHNHDTTDPTVVYCSTDDGNSWSACDNGIPSGLEGHRFIVNPSDHKLYAVIEDGISNDGWVYATTSAVQ